MVTKDVPNHALVLGNPARIAGWMCECGNRLDFHNDIATCNDCEKQFIRHEGGVRCIGCKCGNHPNFQNDVATCNDRKKQFSRHGEKDQCLEEEWDLPQAVENSSVS